jgi:hypothetical protein
VPCGADGAQLEEKAHLLSLFAALARHPPCARRLAAPRIAPALWSQAGAAAAAASPLRLSTPAVAGLSAFAGALCEGPARQQELFAEHLAGLGRAGQVRAARQLADALSVPAP